MMLARNLAAASIAITLLNPPSTHAQTRAPEFEDASIKPNKSASRGFSVEHDAGRFTATNASLQNLIEMAYQVKRTQISGAPDWLNSERFDIVAKAPPSTPKSQILPMLQPLLADRFKLTFHRENKTVSGYALVVAKTGPKLHVSEAENSHFDGDRRSLSGQRMSLAQLADTLSRRLDSPVSDRTGIPGFFDLKLQWTPDEGQPMTKPGADPEPVSQTARTDGPSLFTALQEQLGLKLETRKVPVEILVIDHVEKAPTEN